MDFIERIFGVSPDGGDGTTELMFFGALAIVIVAAVLWRPLLRRFGTGRRIRP